MLSFKRVRLPCDIALAALGNDVVVLTFLDESLCTPLSFSATGEELGRLVGKDRKKR